MSQTKVIQKKRKIASLCKLKFKLKIEGKMRINNLWQVWQRVYSMIGKEEKKRRVSKNGDNLTFANDLNIF